MGKKLHSKPLRLAALLLGVALLLWVPVEDTQTLGVRIFALMLATFATLAIATKVSPHIRQRSLTLPAIGLAAGLLVTPLALLLMAFKTGLHGHGSPDFTPDQVSGVLQSWPIWAAAGLMVGVAVALLQKAR
jgi:hypothetical protein